MTCFCQRCGEELTAPYFHKGQPYGYSCYEKIAGAKAKKSKEVWISCELSKPLSDHKLGEIIIVTINSGLKLNAGINIKGTDGNLSRLNVNLKLHDSGWWTRITDKKGVRLYKNDLIYK